MKSYRIKRQEELQKTIDNLLENISGKTISGAEFSKVWRGDEVASLKLMFSDGSSLDIHPLSEKGCNECDPDGSANDYLDFTFDKRKKM